MSGQMGSEQENWAQGTGPVDTGQSTTQRERRDSTR